MKVILIIGDGMSDRPTRGLPMQTPLQIADTPSLDDVARRGICGVVDPISPGIPPGSDTAFLALLGYDPYQTYTGRGAYEALGSGLEVREHDVAFRGNFATVDDALVVVDRRAGRLQWGGEALATVLNGITLEGFPEVNVIVQHTVEHRLALLLRGPHLSQKVSDSDPHEEHRPVQTTCALDSSSEASRTACLVNAISKRSHELLTNHPINVERQAIGQPPANVILLRGASTLPGVKPITERYGIRALVIAAVALYKGVCKAVGCDVIDVPGATGTVETDAVAKAKAAVANLPEYDYVLIHVKGGDSASHDGNVEEKIRMIEKIDALVKYLLDNVDLERTFIAVTADHTTSLDLKKHVGDPVPFAVMGPGVRADPVTTYSEIACAQGGLGRIRGVDVTPILMDLAGHSTIFGT
jgi:2,3-bisphosphoglycerate-independent phosphoglycerate mutase